MTTASPKLSEIKGRDDCPYCWGLGWVCENHRTEPAHNCKFCDGAGAPCGCFPDHTITDEQMAEQAKRCPCGGADDYCSCQNMPDRETREGRSTTCPPGEGRHQMTLDDVHEVTAEAMDTILECFKEGSKITVLVRAPGFPSRDFCVTNDDLAEVSEMIARRRAEMRKREGQS